MAHHLDADGNVTKPFAALLVWLAAGYPTTGKLSEATIRAYAGLLDGIAIEDVARACHRVGRHGDGRFFPSAAELRRVVEASIDDAALAAWAMFGTAAEVVGAYADLEVEDQAAAQALLVVFGSWLRYCTMDDREVTSRRTEFLAAYRAARRRDGPGTKRLRGLCDVSSVALIGRVQRDGVIALTDELASTAMTTRTVSR